MQIGVVGGTGTFGALASEELARRGHTVSVLSRRPPAIGSGPPVHRRVDLSTGDGLAEALSGLDVVVDAVNVARPGRRMRAVMVEGTERLLRAEADAGVDFHVLISIVGIESVPMSYYRVKLEQERLVREGPVRFGVLRSTQFHQLVDGAFRSASRFGVLPAGGTLLQPVDPREVARVLADSIDSGSWQGRLDVAGPEVLSLSQLAHAWAHAMGRRRARVPLPLVGKVGRALRAGALTSEDATRCQLRFADWLPQAPGAREGGAEPPAGSTVST